MRGLWTIYRRELAGLFVGPLAWILLCLALAMNGLAFVSALEQFSGDISETMRFSMGGSFPFWFLMIVLPPLLTMRMISEESRSGMLEFLLTAPVSDGAVVLGKFLAATTTMAILWLAFLVYGLVLASVGGSPDWLPLVGGVAGSILTSCLFCAIGILCSALTSTPMLSLFFGVVFNALFFSFPLAIGFLESDTLNRIAKSVDVYSHFYRSFNIGVLDSAPLAFFVAWTALFLFLAIRRVEMRRWS
jgi:ABC-2 type transport system permease protein